MSNESVLTMKYSDNTYIRIAERFYDSIVDNNYSNIVVDTIREKVKYSFTDRYTERKEYNYLYDRYEKSMLTELNRLDDYYKSFMSIWQYCQFIKWAEHTVLYKNDSDKVLCEDTAIDEDCKRLVINKPDEFQIFFKLELVKDPAVYTTLSDIISNNTEQNKFMKVITLEVQRLYGKKLNSKFTIVNDTINLQDSEDIYLKRTIDHILYKCMIETSTLIGERIVEVLTEGEEYYENSNAKKYESDKV